MPQLWQQQDGQWNPIVLSDAAATFALRREVGEDTVLVKAEGEHAAWALLATPTPTSPVRVNGEALFLGMRILRDRDAIQIGSDHPIFFSTESMPVVAAFACKKPVPCARCRTLVHPGDPAVQCPRCGAVHHQNADAELECWTYADRCAGCHGQSTSLDAQNVWTPAEL